VRTCFKALPEEQRNKFAAEVQGFVGQEATHRRIHQLFNGHLERLGFVNKIEVIGAKRIQKGAHLDPRVHLAATAAIEHFTALFADWMLRHPEAL
jgi:predicted metal-dependent hydrolase